MADGVKLVMSWQNVKPMVACMARTPIALIYLLGWVNYVPMNMNVFSFLFWTMFYVGIWACMISMEILITNMRIVILSMIGVFWSLIELVNDYYLFLEWSMIWFFSMIGIFSSFFRWMTILRSCCVILEIYELYCTWLLIENGMP